MSHRAAVYTVEVHRMGEPTSSRLLGDFDDEGTALINTLNAYIPTVNIDLGSRRLRYLNSKIEDHDLLVMFEHGQGGVDANIRNKEGETRYHQVVEDSQDIECGCLIRLPPNKRTGWLAVHIPNRRGIKTMLAEHLRARFREQFPEFTLKFTPYVLESALREAVDLDLIEKVTLVKRIKPSDRAMVGIDQWVGEQYFGKIEVVIGARFEGKAQALLPGPVRRFLQGDQGAKDAIVEFQNMTFDEAKVTVQQGDGVRTFNIERLDAGHPLTEDMHLPEAKPSPEDIFAGLRASLQTVGTSA